MISHEDVYPNLPVANGTPCEEPSVCTHLSSQKPIHLRLAKQDTSASRGHSSLIETSHIQMLVILQKKKIIEVTLGGNNKARDACPPLLSIKH